MSKSIKPNGQQLLANFQNAMVSVTTINAAHYEADRSEQELVQHLQNVSSGTYLQPNALAGDQELVSKASLDAHIKKVQADQLDNISAYQLQQLQQQSFADYVGRKVQISVRATELQPVETVWFDQRNGFRSNVTKKQMYAGTIKEIILEKNVMVILPKASSRMLNGSLHSYIVYVIDPATAAPLVDITLS